MGFIEPVKRKEKTNQNGIVKKQLKNIEDGFKYILENNEYKFILPSSATLCCA